MICDNVLDFVNPVVDILQRCYNKGQQNLWHKASDGLPTIQGNYLVYTKKYGYFVATLDSIWDDVEYWMKIVDPTQIDQL